MWDTQKQVKFQYGIYLRKQHDNEPLLVGPLHLEIKFYFHIPRTTNHSPGDYHMFKPDLSNLIKLIEDVGSGILYEDDALIASIAASKHYDSSPRIEFSLHTLNEGSK
jgi:Holliday junction resolvase RusA-like endonuclease